MKKIFTLCTFLSLFTTTFSQSQVEKNKVIAANFVSLFNTQKYDSIVLMFSPEMKAALPVDKFTQVCNGLKVQMGDISNIRFVRFQNPTALYETNFSKGKLGMNITLNAQNEIAGLLFKAYTETSAIIRNSTKMSLPFKGEWTVFWGGDTKELNYHVESKAQKGAFDIMIMDTDGKTHKGTGQSNEDYYAFGKELYAPCDGEVVLVVDGVKDNIPGIKNPIYVPGNTVIIKTDKNEYAFFAHFKQHSIKVKQGQRVRTRDLLGLCGNSGNSTEAHLHFHLQNVEDMNIAIGAKCYFDKLLVNGSLKSDYSPIKGDKITSAN